MKKKTFTLLIALLSVLLLCSCTNNKNDDNSDIQQSSDSNIQETSLSSETVSELSEKSDISQISEKADETNESSANKPQSSENSDNETQNSQTESSEESELGFVDFSDEGEDLTLREIYETSRYSDLIDSTIKQNSNDKYDISISLEGEKDIVVTATLKDNISSDKLSQTDIDNYLNSIQSQADMYIGLLENTTTTKNIHITAIIENADGTKLASRTFSRKEPDEQTDTESGSDFTLDDIADSELLSNAISQIKNHFGDSADVTSFTEGDHTLVINININQDIPDQAADSFKQQLEEYTEIINTISSGVKNISGDENASVVFRITDADGTVIAEKSA